MYSNHYIRTDGQSRIIEGWSDGPDPDRDAAGAIRVTDRGGYQFRLFGEENPALINKDGAHLYKYVDGEAMETTGKERAAELAEILAALPPPAPTMADVLEENKLLRAQIQAQSDRADFVEDCMAEIAMQVYA